MELISQKEWAIQQGFSPQYVTTLIKLGVVIPVLHGKHRMIDPAQADAGLTAFQDPARKKKRKNATPEQAVASQDNTNTAKIHAKAKAANEIKKGKLLDFELKVQDRELVSAAEVESDAFKIARTVRDRILQVPDRIAATLAAEMDSQAVRRILEDELRIALKALTDAN